MYCFSVVLVSECFWLGGRDSNPDSQIQSLESYHWTTSQQEGFEFTNQISSCQLFTQYPTDPQNLMLEL